MPRRFALICTLSTMLVPALAVSADSASPAAQAITSNAAPAAIGPYSQAVLSNGTLYVSGQIALDPKTGQLVAADIRAQTKQVFANLTAVLEAAHMTLANAVQVQVFLADLEDFAAMNEIYATAFKAPYPARFTVQVARLPRDARIEIGLIAVKR